MESLREYPQGADEAFKVPLLRKNQGIPTFCRTLNLNYRVISKNKMFRL